MLTDEQRRRLAVKGKVLGRRQLEQASVVAQADTVLRWHRELIGYFSKPVSYDNTVVGDTAFENDVAAPSLVIVTIPIRHIAEPTTQSSRGPPADARPAIFHRDSRNAA